MPLAGQMSLPKLFASERLCLSGSRRKSTRCFEIVTALCKTAMGADLRDDLDFSESDTGGRGDNLTSTGVML
ncbi:hypothetical protein OL67_002659 [Phaeobacter piscinae]|nr:hypothetical protein OL67_002659 [Phaeobacter piscinae]